MIKAIHFPYEITGRELDDYLSLGWFRMGQTIFTTDFIPVDDNIHRVYWLRVLVQQVRYGKKQERLLAINKNFSVVVKPFRPSDELEALYTEYRAAVNFDAPPSANGYLLDETMDEFKNIYDTHVIELRDAGRLIAAGIFDKGENSIAGIMNFYHPAYRSKSPGKFLMLLKINLAVESGKLYYYPGYLVSGISKFDYKLFPDPQRTEWYDSLRGEWIPYSGSFLPGIAGLSGDSDRANE
jgi:arginyl-tRNA--protein-N-Asp/Glu arginylyltransferase